jgi:type I restriction enzyme, S subunit
MASNWKHTTLGDIALDPNGAVDGPFGSNLPASAYTDSGYPIIRGSNLSIGLDEFKDNEFVFVTEDVFQKLSRSECRAGDIIFTKKGTLGQTGLIGHNHRFKQYLISSNQMRLRVDPKKALAEYVYYYVSSQKAIDKLIQDSECTGVPKINLAYLKSFPISLPSLREQKRIIDILGCINTKITLNRQINQTLEQMAQALFKSWFVDFDPVVDNALDAGFFEQELDLPDELLRRAEARQVVRNRPDFKPLPDATRQLFPAAFEACPEPSLGLGGWVPQGWEANSIGSVSRLVKGKSYKSSELATSDTALVTLKSFQRGGGYRLDGLKPYIGSYKKEQVVSAGDLIISCTDVTQAADIIGKPAIVISDPSYKTLVISLDVSTLRPNKENLRYYLYELAKTLEFQSHIYAHSTGTTVLHLSKDAVPDFMFPSPSEKILKIYHEMVSPFFDVIEKNNCSLRTLTSLRDTLLPKLISGELQLDNIKAELATEQVN